MHSSNWDLNEIVLLKCVLKPQSLNFRIFLLLVPLNYHQVFMENTKSYSLYLQLARPIKWLRRHQLRETFIDFVFFQSDKVWRKRTKSFWIHSFSEQENSHWVIFVKTVIYQYVRLNFVFEIVTNVQWCNFFNWQQNVNLAIVGEQLGRSNADVSRVRIIFSYFFRHLVRHHKTFHNFSKRQRTYVFSLSQELNLERLTT